VLDAEAAAILGAKGRLGTGFLRALELMRACEGHIVVTGLGKPGFIAQKLSATLASTGVPSLYLHPSEALHGDLGRVSRGDVVLALSNSGSTEELVRLLPSLRRLGATVIAITGTATHRSPGARTWCSTWARSPRRAPGAGAHRQLGRAARGVGCPGDDPPQDAPVQQRGVRGAAPRRKLGRSVMRVLEVMRAGQANPVVRADAPLVEAVVVMTNTPGGPAPPT
jgi:arabinose-5-phosphate isomerase